MNLWPHQQRGLSEIESLINRGVKDIAVTSPTGGGKSLMMARACDFTHLGVGFFCVRRTHTENIRDALQGFGKTVGVRAAGYETESYWKQRIQIGSIQTEASRCERPEYTQPEFHIVQLDEAHLQANEQADAVLKPHREAGAITLHWTATPLGIYRPGMELVVAGVNSELRRTGAHLPCHVYAPSEIDMSHVKKVKIGEDFTSGQLKNIISQQVVGNVIEHYLRLNPDQKPCLVMAPDVKGAVFLAEQFDKARSGIAANA
jgi:superfamily II DNA or RNA helicase